MGIAANALDGDVLADTPTGDAAAEVEGVLAWLATAPDGIGITLIRAGVVGVKCESTECPVSRYVTTITGHEAIVGDRTLTVIDRFQNATEIPLPRKVATFIDDFDAGGYPILESVNVRRPMTVEKDTFWKDRHGGSWIVTRSYKSCVRLDNLYPPDRFLIIGADHLRWAMTYIGRNS